MPCDPTDSLPPATRILLVDNHALVRVGCRSVLSGVPGLQVVAEADSGEGAYQAYRQTNPHVVITELLLPGLGGLETMQRIRLRDPTARFLVLSSCDGLAYVHQALQAGALGYITKRCCQDVLIQAVHQTALGEGFLEDSVAQRLVISRLRGAVIPFATLSTREFEIFRLLADGQGAAAIATHLSLSKKNGGQLCHPH